jgi:hypothetical protein
MNHLADALVYAVSHIGCRDDEDDDSRLDIDVKALECLASILQTATAAELDAVAAAAKRAFAATPPHSRWAEDCATWMEDMLGDEEWSGNDRV